MISTSAADGMIGRLLDGRYRIRAQIARGGMATVYLATDLRLERRVAVKIMHDHLTDDAAFKSRFVQEARSAARLAHPNVVNVFDQGQDTHSAYLVMEYLPGITLRDLLKDFTKLKPPQVVDIMDAVLSGLAAAHKAGIVHRDVKPENVLLCDDGRIKLGDFGLARATNANTMTGQALLGTIAYISPELVTRGQADARSDLYAIGIMLYELLTGEQPYTGEAAAQIAYQHAHNDVPPPSNRDPSIPPEFDELVLWATSRNPESRPRDAQELLDRLRTLEPAIRSARPSRHITRILPGPEPITAAPSEATQQLAPTRRVGGPESSITTLHRTGLRHRKRGLWMLVLFLILAAASVSAGWYFGAGPGALVTIPNTSGMDPATATSALRTIGFTVGENTKNSPQVPSGKVIDTTPGSGSVVRRDAAVTINISAGPRILTVPANLVGAPESDVRAQLRFFTVTTDPKRQFSTSIAAGSVVALSDGDGKPLPAQYPELRQIVLRVSAGAVPDVTNEPSAQAKADLERAGLTVTYADPQFDNSGKVPAGSILSAKVTTDPVLTGDTVQLTESKGQDLVTVPAVVGQRMSDAIATLKAAGFQVTYALPDSFVKFAVVTAQDPAGNGKALRGSAVNLTGQFTL